MKWFSKIVLSCALASLAVVSVRTKSVGSESADVSPATFGAVCDGRRDDGAAFQAALDFVAQRGGGSVLLPAATCFIDRTLVVGDRTTIRGSGPLSILVRGNTSSVGPLYQGPTNCETNVGFTGRALFMNSRYNCGNRGIILSSFAIDGSRVTDVPLSVLIAFSAIADTHIDSLSIVGAAQDAIFFKNGGVNTSITNTTIDGFNMHWGNGAGIHIEMWANANLPTDPATPVLISNNRIVVRGLNFCTGGPASENLRKPCDGDAQCASGKCGDGAVYAINAGKPGGASSPGPGAAVIISNNQVELTNRHYGIGSFFSAYTQIEGNRIAAIKSATAWSGLSTGIVCTGNTGTEIVKSNELDSMGLPDDGRGILLTGGTTQAAVLGNAIVNRSARWNLAMLEIRGYTSAFEIGNNSITAGSGSHGLVIGACGDGRTSGGIVHNNLVSMPGIVGTVFRPIVLRNATNITLTDNVTSPSVPVALQCPPAT